MKSEIYMLDKQQLAHYQDKIEACLDADPTLWNRRFESKEELWQNVFTDYVQMWAVCDADCIHCIFMTEIASRPIRVLRIFWAYGERLLEAFPLVDLVLERFAHGMQCEEIEVSYARKGWDKVIRASGGEFLGATYRRPVRLVRGN